MARRAREKGNNRDMRTFNRTSLMCMMIAMLTGYVSMVEAKAEAVLGLGPEPPPRPPPKPKPAPPPEPEKPKPPPEPNKG